MSHNDSTTLAEISERNRIWDKHKANNNRIADLYKGSKFDKYQQRMQHCGNSLEFSLESDKLKLTDARFCRVRYCPVCQWRRSLKWKARAYAALPKILQNHPKSRWLFLTLTIKNCEINELRETLTSMHQSFKRLTKLKAWYVEGWIKSTEITLGQDGLAHPHFHCLLMVKPSYFSGEHYLSQAKWAELWQQCLRINYLPVVDVRAIKASVCPTTIIPEVLKYQTKSEDLTADQDWLLELTAQTHGSRAISVGGILSDYLKKSDFQGSPSEADTEEASFFLRAYWSSKKNLYCVP